ncbi:MAG: DUF4286 family protein [Chitinophagaceae bacterium]|nr:DUF4286 family protein [Chitinophagaceae bacterium]
MYTLNITFKVEHNVFDDWYNWMREDFINGFHTLQDIENTQLNRLLGHDDEHGVTAVLQVVFLSEDELRKYLDNYQDEFARKVSERWGERVVFFQTAMKKI